MKITNIDVHVLLEPAFDASATSSAQDNIVNCVLAGDDESILYCAQLNARFIGRVTIK